MRIIFKIIIIIMVMFYTSGCSGETKMSAEDLFAEGQYLEKEEAFNSAIGSYETILKNYPESEEAAKARSRAATLYYNMNNYDKAISLYDAIIKNNPDDLEAYFMRGACGYESGKYEPAIKDMNKILELEPDFVSAYYVLGEIYLHKGEYDTALDNYDKAIALNPNYAKYYYGRATTYHDKALNDKETGLYDKAIADYSKIQDMDPEFKPAQVFKFRADSYNNTGRYVEAIADYTRAIELAPKDAVLYCDRGNAYLRSNRYEEAKEDYVAAIELDPEGRIGKIAYDNLEILVNHLEQQASAPQQLSQYEIDKVNSMEKEWAMNIDKAVPLIQERNYTGADVYIKKARETVSGINEIFRAKRYVAGSIDRLVAMDNLVSVYENLNLLSAYANDPNSAARDWQRVQQTLNDTYNALNTAEAKFHEVPALQGLCREIRSILNQVEMEVRKYIR